MSALWMAVATHLWQTTLVLLVLGGLAHLLRRAPARYLEALWTAGLLKLMVPLSLITGLLPALQGLAARAEEQQAIGPAVKTLSQIAYPEMLWVEPVASATSFPSPRLAMVVTTLWVGGAAAFLLLWLRRSKVPAIVAAEPWNAADDIAGRVSRAARAARVPLGRIRIGEGAVMPSVRNPWRPIVLLSVAVVEALSPDELRAVLLHEDAHRRRRDLWRGAVNAVVARLFFFYPPAWWLERRLRQSAEMACDEAVLAAGIDARTYARALARTVDLGLTPTAAPMLGSNTSSLRERFQRIKAPERYSAMHRHRFAVVAAFIAAAGLSFVPGADGRALTGSEGAPTAEQQWWVSADELQGLNGLDTNVVITHQDASLAQVLEELGRLAGFDVFFMSGDDLSLRVSVSVADTPARAVLGLLADLRGIEYRVVDARTLIVKLTPREREVDALVVLRGDDEAEVAALVHRQRAQEVPVREPPVQETPVREIRKAPARVDGPMRVGGDIVEPERIHYVRPVYPELARKARMEGAVIVQATVGRDGRVKDVEMLRPLGLGLDVAAIDAVRQWRYTPTYYNGEPVEVLLTITVVFELIK